MKNVIIMYYEYVPIKIKLGDKNKNKGINVFETRWSVSRGINGSIYSVIKCLKQKIL